MGNLISFPLLCLLNKACFDIACDIRDRKRRDRIGRFNGDDCMFCGDSEFFGTWRSVTSIYGLIVNEEKTGISRRWIELNSQSFDVRRRALVAKATLGFLRPLRDEPGSMLRSVIVGMRGFMRDHVGSVIRMMRHEISLRGVLEDLGSLGPFWRDQLVKKRWFRAAAMLGGAPTLEKGVDRGVPMLIGPPPRSRFFDFVTRAAARTQRDNTEKWKGVGVIAHERKLDRRSYKELQRRTDPQIFLRKFRWDGYEWAFVWPRSLYEVCKAFPDLFSGCTRGKWFDDHLFLTRRPCVVEVGKVRRDFSPTVSLLTGVDCLPLSRL